MKTPVFTVDHDDDLERASTLMQEQGVRHLPVVRDTDIVGMVSARDILRASLRPGQPETATMRAFTGIPVADVMSRPAITVDAQTPVSRAAGIIRMKKLGALAVTEGLAVVGILSALDLIDFAIDILRNQQGKETDVTQLRVKDLMTARLDVLSAYDSVDLARVVMQLDDVRHLPVVDGDKVVGMLSHRDILRAQHSELTHSPGEIRRFESKCPVRAIMTHTVETVSPDAPALEAATKLREFGFGALPVVDENKLVGIITTTDFLEMVIRHLSDPN